MASRLDDLIRERAERLDQLAGPIDLTDVTSAARHHTTNVALIDIEPTWTQPEGRHRWPITAVAAAAVVAVVVVVVGGLMMAKRTDDPTRQVPVDQPATVAPTTTVDPRRETGAIEGGGSVTYIVPDGWENWGIGVATNMPGGPGSAMILMADEDFYTRINFTSPCPPTSGRIEGLLGPVGPTVDDLVSAWADLPGVDVTGASYVTIDGFDGRQFEFDIPPIGACNLLFFNCSFDDPEEPDRPTRCSEGIVAGLFNVAGVHQKVWVLDVDGDRVIIIAAAEASEQDRAVLDEIVASIEFD